MRVVPRGAMWLALAAIFLTTGITSANVVPNPRQELKKQFAEFFARVDETSLEAFGALKNSPATLKAIEKQIDSMSDEQVAGLRETIGEFPTPGAIAEMFPPEAREAMKKRAAESAALAPQAEQMRDDILALTQILAGLPDGKLSELGIDRSRLDSIRTAFTRMSTIDATLLQKQLSGATEWQSQSAQALEMLPPAVRRGMAALAKHGPMTGEDLAELEKFRSEVVRHLRRVEALPAEFRTKMDLDGLGLRIADISVATPDALFMIRLELTAEKMRQLDQNLASLERVSNLTGKDIDELNQFRTELIEGFGRLQSNGASARELETKLSGLDARQLMLLRQKIGDPERVTVALPAVYRTLSAPGFAERIVALNQNPDPAAVGALEDFRKQALLYAATADVEPELAERARQTFEKASLPALEFIRALNANLPENASARTRLQVVTDAVDLDCRWCVDLWVTDACIDINWICTPLENAINAVEGAIRTAVDTAIATLTGIVNTVNTTLTGIITDISNGVNALTAVVNNVVTGILNTVNLIWNAVETIGTTVSTAITNVLKAFLDIDFPGETFSMWDIVSWLTTSSRIHEGINIVKSNLVDHQWERLDNEPLDPILCPQAGFPTAFGAVGTTEAARQAERYQYFLDELIDLVPNTEVSLYAKWHVYQVLEDWKVLAVCLKQAAEDTAAAAAAAAEAGRLNTIVNTSNSNRSILYDQIATSFNAVAGQNLNLSNLITGSTTTLQNAINNASNATQTLVNEVKAGLTEAENLELRLQIEMNLVAKDALAVFQLPGAHGGYLEVTRDVVNSAISAMLAAGQSVGQASRYYNDAVSAMGLGKFKDAYGNFQSAYRELTTAK